MRSPDPMDSDFPSQPPVKIDTTVPVSAGY
jgi:hypothetical protein